MDLAQLLKLRLVVARFGEMDVARWWNTNGQLGPLGAVALKRGFPRTHRFAAARSVFAVARRRCTELIDRPECVTLWRLPESVEEEFDARWEDWLDNAAEWDPFFATIENVGSQDLAGLLRGIDAVTEVQVQSATGLRRSAEGRAVVMPSHFSGSNDDLALLALGFGKGEPGALAVPYAHTGQ